MSRDRAHDPGDLHPREAVTRYLRRRRSDSTDASVKSWKYRLKLFVEWCQGVGIDRIGDLRGYDIDEYYELRSGAIAPATLEGEMWTLQTFVEYLEQLGAVEEDLSDSVRVPDLDPSDRANSESLSTEAAFALLNYYRDSEVHRATRKHAFLELAWHTGARQGGLRALDVRDVYPEEGYVEFHHRPKTGTPLKNKQHGERPVSLRDEVAAVLREFMGNRYDVRDGHDRQPYLASRYGRPTENTIRNWSYVATQPCLHSPCPHGKERPSCEYTEYTHASKCPSSRSPHRIRTGAVTWMLNAGIPPEIVAQRVNASVQTIRDHYDWATDSQRWSRYHDQMNSRREHLQKLDFANDTEFTAE
ncbi:tyrosine-type recombinase/integrase [Halorubrum amylolyticum]|uniref:tyrosine-type recombinase/integrase n=1 Tax=Halorubrum amylolyticum TaxID=2508724 RepID=UPI001008871F|nr:site-specific integrase [Halorubrum amylolyticum]